MEIMVRKAVTHDLDAILRLNKALFEYETAFNTEYNLGWTYSEVGKNYFTKKIEVGNALVAEVEQKVVGYIAISIYEHSYRKENPIAELDNMFVEEESRGKGVGKKLVEEAKNIAKQSGAKRMKVEAAAQNAKAAGFYRSCGFSDFDLVLQTSL